VNILLAVSVFYTLPAVRIEPKTNLLLTALLFTVVSVSWRGVFGLLLRRSGGAERIAFIGMDAHVQQALAALQRDPVDGYNVCGVIAPRGEPEPAASNASATTLIRCEDEEVLEQVKSLDVDRVIVTDSLHKELRQVLYKLLYERVSVSTFASFWEEYTDTVPIYATDEIWFLENLRNVQKTSYERVKRVVDILLCIIFVPILLAILPLVALAIKLNSRGPIFFTQERVGALGDIFNVVKFRTMRKDAEAAGPQWASEKDPRITAVGSLLRLTRADELPQLFNVLRGTMSIIGPRPERPYFVEKLAEQIPHYRLRTLIKPGLTGWAQVHLPYGDSEESAARKLEYDLYYLKNRSLSLDFRVILKTIRVVLLGKGR
jgi:exopolysaccharide biosynthesis polyprenyl glycosylphosphotransferase